MKRPITIPLAAVLALAATAASAATPTPPKFSHGLPDDPNYFPIAVWLQSPENASKFKAAGINLFIGLWQGPTEGQLAALKAAKMPVICEQNPVGLAHLDDSTIVGWMQQDEPDNAQPITDAAGKPSYGPCVPPPEVVARYTKMHTADPSRPVLLNLGQGVSDDSWIGRGSGAHLDDYKTYVNGGDIVSFDIYPVAGLADGENKLFYVPQGLDRLKTWTSGKERVWNCIECTHIGGDKRATPAQVRAEVWMSLIHGSTGLVYFVHQFKPTFDEHALLDDPEMLPAVTALNAQIHELAPALNSPTLTGATATPASADVPVDVMLKRIKSVTYLFTVGMRNHPAHAAFQVPGLSRTATAEVIGEARSLPVHNGKFEDSFEPYGVHLYRIRK
ncbi:MAG: hypothetical protein M3Y56_10780 [Armatimonadota bacterium]|nr:hypothetical protein [Armatimonadota bacterium]